MRNFQSMVTVIFLVVVILSSANSNAQICIGGNCTESDHVGPIEMHQFNGRTERCFGSGCDDLGISRFRPNSLQQGETDFDLRLHYNGQGKYALPIPMVEENVRCKNTTPFDRQCHTEVWYQVRNADLLSDVSRTSGCSEQEIINALKKTSTGTEKGVDLF